MPLGPLIEFSFRRAHAEPTRKDSLSKVVNRFHCDLFNLVTLSGLNTILYENDTIWFLPNAVSF
jgi:hypothetical protein